MKKNKISAVTVLYNFDEKVISNIKTYENYVDEVILIDNSDTSDYFNLYKEQLKKYTYPGSHIDRQYPHIQKKKDMIG